MNRNRDKWISKLETALAVTVVATTVAMGSLALAGKAKYIPFTYPAAFGAYALNRKIQSLDLEYSTNQS